MTIGSHNFVKFTVIKPNCQKHSVCVFASDKNTMYPCARHQWTWFFVSSDLVYEVLSEPQKATNFVTLQNRHLNKMLSRLKVHMFNDSLKREIKRIE